MCWGIDMKEFLETLIRSLNGIEVKGRDNLELLLGSIMAAEDKLLELTAEESAEESAEEETADG